MEHLALILFTLCLQAAIGVMLFVAIGKFVNREAVFKKAIVVAGVLAIIGLVASLLHLGQPFSAPNSLRQFGSSWLSREIWFSAIFAGLTIVSAILVLLKPAMRGAITGLAAVAAVVGLVDVYAMGAIYRFTSVPAWQSVATVVEFYASAIGIGGLLFLALSGKEVPKLFAPIAIIVAAVAALQVAIVVPQYFTMATEGGAAMAKSIAVFASLSGLMLVKWLLILAGAGIGLFAGAKGQADKVSSFMLAAAVLFIIGEAIGRHIFYAVMVVTGVGMY